MCSCVEQFGSCQSAPRVVFSGVTASPRGRYPVRPSALCGITGGGAVRNSANCVVRFVKSPTTNTSNVSETSLDVIIDPID